MSLIAKRTHVPDPIEIVRIEGKPNTQIRIENIGNHKYAVFNGEEHVSTIDVNTMLVKAEVVEVNGVKHLRVQATEGIAFYISLEHMIQDTTDNEPKTISLSHCKSCGAPVNRGRYKCEYCGTPYYGWRQYE